MVDHVRNGLDADVGDIDEPNLASSGLVDHQVLQIGHAAAALGWAPQLDVVGPAAREKVTGLLTGHQPRCGPSDVAWLEAVPLGRREVDLDLQLRDVVLEVDVVLADAGNITQQPVDLLCFLPKQIEILAEDADRDGVAGSGQDLPDALPQVGQHVAVDPRVAVDHSPDVVDGLVVVDRSDRR